jgi:hypothetical protein
VGFKFKSDDHASIYHSRESSLNTDLVQYSLHNVTLDFYPCMFLEQSCCAHDVGIRGSNHFIIILKLAGLLLKMGRQWGGRLKV